MSYIIIKNSEIVFGETHIFLSLYPANFKRTRKMFIIETQFCYASPHNIFFMRRFIVFIMGITPVVHGIARHVVMLCKLKIIRMVRGCDTALHVCSNGMRMLVHWNLC